MLLLCTLDGISDTSVDFRFWFSGFWVTVSKRKKRLGVVWEISNQSNHAPCISENTLIFGEDIFSRHKCPWLTWNSVGLSTNWYKLSNRKKMNRTVLTPIGCLNIKLQSSWLIIRISVDDFRPHRLIESVHCCLDIHCLVDLDAFPQFISFIKALKMQGCLICSK